MAKHNGTQTWESSGASEIDWLLHYDGEINDDDIDVPNRNFGWTD